MIAGLFLGETMRLQEEGVTNDFLKVVTESRFFLDKIVLSDNFDSFIIHFCFDGNL